MHSPVKRLDNCLDGQTAGLADIFRFATLPYPGRIGLIF
jgi:hypothetical protein